MTRPDRARSEAAARLPLLLLLCAVVLGIVGMHGLVLGHGASEHGHHAAMTSTSSADPAATAAHGTDGDRRAGAIAGEDSPADDGEGLLAMCLMVLTPGLVLGLWLLVASAACGSWRLPRRLVRIVATAERRVVSPPFQRLTVLRI